MGRRKGRDEEGEKWGNRGEERKTAARPSGAETQLEASVHEAFQSVYRL